MLEEMPAQEINIQDATEQQMILFLQVRLVGPLLRHSHSDIRLQAMYTYKVDTFLTGLSVDQLMALAEFAQKMDLHPDLVEQIDASILRRCGGGERGVAGMSAENLRHCLFYAEQRGDKSLRDRLLDEVIQRGHGRITTVLKGLGEPLHLALINKLLIKRALALS